MKATLRVVIEDDKPLFAWTTTVDIDDNKKGARVIQAIDKAIRAKVADSVSWTLEGLLPVGAQASKQ